MRSFSSAPTPTLGCYSGLGHESCYQLQGLFFSETSALSGDNVENAFLKLLEEINRVVSKKALECGIGVGNGDNNVATLKGSKIDIISGPELEISEMKKLSSCSC
ncbi:hypothetical protein Lalb_Chr09g0332721 [Lupinus albus]|uniref:Uncharacterized protein n=1 Tax=Lupinus albus TaxID=3870 RepID=A0A6A4Q2F3_LUPAL|nr:hypothetical protein Lalb_Chr09g0332721 [Lupinus albus]